MSRILCRSRFPVALFAGTIAAACAPARAPARAHAQRTTAESPDAQAAAATNMQMSGMPHGGMHSMDMSDAHMYMTPRRAATPADSMRAARLVVDMRQSLAKYRDVHAAIADGYAQFLPNVPQQVYHFTSWRNAVAEAFRFDPARPTSLLYRKNTDGSFTLIGAMYTEPRRASEQALDQRIPLSIAQWHQHVNLCLPPRDQRSRWTETADGKPVFGPRSPIATEAACSAVGGRFVPHLFGWMVHANVFASSDPAVVWGHVD
ncbi:MAG: hypothetical protein ACR2MQ_14760 [Gemmatimonadaceae bacterium]